MIKFDLLLKRMWTVLACSILYGSFCSGSSDYLPIDNAR